MLGKASILVALAIAASPAYCAMGTLQSRSELVVRDAQVPRPNEFIRRSLLAVAVVGDHVYIEGGEVSSIWDDNSTPVNVTLSLPLSSSWTNDTVEFQEISKGASPWLKQQRLWYNESDSTIYSWGGAPPYDNDTDSDNIHLWALKTDSSGGGSWEIQTPANPVQFMQIYRTSRGMSTSCNGVGYHLDGFSRPPIDSRIEAAQGENFLISGLLTYDMETAIWTNESSNALDYVSWGGSATCLPDIGSKGLILFLGGTKSTESGTEGNQTPVSFANVTMYDPETKEWYWQITSGNPPDGRVDYCTVGVQGPNGTFEIYMFGGWNPWSAKPYSFGDIWVLSLPGFRWFKADTSTTPRAMHDCALVGKRQMLGVGGLNYGVKGTNGWRDPDPWTQGLGILDLPTLTWSSRYDSDASDYDSPDVVKEWYGEGKTAEWSSDKVSELFAVEGTQTSGTPSGSTSQAPPGDKKSESSTPVGAIVGGVVGGIAAVAAIIGILFFLRRRKRKAGSTPEVDGSQWPKAELPADTQRQEYMYGPRPTHELDISHGYSELPSQQHTLSELPASPLPMPKRKPVKVG